MIPEEEETLKELIYEVYEAGAYKTKKYKGQTDGFTRFDFKGKPKKTVKGGSRKEKTKKSNNEIEATNLPVSNPSSSEQTSPEIDYENTVLKGKSYSAAGFSDEEEAVIAESVEKNGGIYLFNFATKLDYLIYKSDTHSEPIKMKKAKLLEKRGAEVSFITIEEYHEMIR